MTTLIIIIVLFFVFVIIFFSKRDPEKTKKATANYYIHSDWPNIKSEKITSLQVAGVRHYKGEVRPGDTVVLTVDPHNEYDKNAIEVRNLSMDMIGYIPKTKNKNLLKIMDDEDLFGTVTAVYRNHTEVHIDIKKVIG